MTLFDEILDAPHSIFLRYLEDAALNECKKRQLLVDRAKREIARLEAEIGQLRGLIGKLDHTEIGESAAKGTIGTVGPLTPDQQRKRAARDQKKRDRISTIQTSSAKKISDIQATIGECSRADNIER